MITLSVYRINHSDSVICITCILKSAQRLSERLFNPEVYWEYISNYVAVGSERTHRPPDIISISIKSVSVFRVRFHCFGKLR